VGTVDTSSSNAKQCRGEPWALGAVLGYASANIFDRFAIVRADPLIGPLLRGLPSLLLGVALVWKNRTLGQIRPGSPRYVGRRTILLFVLAGFLSTVGLFIYYFAMRIGGVVITVPVLETYVIWGAVIAWVFLGERMRPFGLVGVGLIATGLATLAWGQHRGEPLSPHWYWAIPLASATAIIYGVSGVLWRAGQLRGMHQSMAILLQFVSGMAVAAAGLCVFGRLSLLLGAERRDVLALLGSGVLSGIIGIYCMFTALRLMAVARVFAFSSLTPLLASLFAHFFLCEYLNSAMLAGIVLVSLGVALTQIFRPEAEGS